MLAVERIYGLSHCCITVATAAQNLNSVRLSYNKLNTITILLPDRLLLLSLGPDEGLLDIELPDILALCCLCL